MLSALVFSLTVALNAADEVKELNGLWEFRKDGVESWSKVRVPHDWAIGADFDTRYDAGSGMLPWVGTGEYRREITLSDHDVSLLRSGGEAYLEFDGVMSRAAVKVNGTAVGGSVYGYLGFSIPVGVLLKAGTNSVEVAADTRFQRSRFYCGGGIYRDVRLRILPKGHIIPGSVVIRQSAVTKRSAEISVEWENDDGRRGRKEFTVDNPRFWDVDDPYLYELELGGAKYRYGIRTIAFSAEDGFHLNGRRVQLKGVCLHSDLGLLGMAFSKDAARRRLAIMRDMGVNAIRTSHNCPDPKLLDLCDEMGFVVIDECFDKWDAHAGWTGDMRWEDYIGGVLRKFIRRDINHPCVVAWSIGNEIPHQSVDYYTGVSRARCRHLRELVRSIDDSRPVGIAAWQADTVDAFQDLDYTGWNYARRYMPMKRKYPHIPIIYTESGSSFSDYGYYGSGAPVTNRVDYNTDIHRICGYDSCSAKYSDIPDSEFWRTEKDSYLAGEFVWTGIDYLGEPAPWVWGENIARSSSFGIVDLTGFPKDRFWLYRSHWNKDAETVHLLPHWNWEGRADKVTVMVYTSGDEAELFLNGKSLGRRGKSAQADYPVDFLPPGDPRYYDICRRYRLIWEAVPYAPGTLKAVAYRNGKVIGEDIRETSGKAVALRTSLDPYSRAQDEIFFVRVEAVDSAGRLDPWNMSKVRLSITGPGEIVAAGNGNPHERTGFASLVQPLFYGRAMVAVRRLGEGEITVHAEWR